MAEESGDVSQHLIDLGTSIRNLRKSQGLTQEQLSETTEQFGDNTGVSESAIKDLERPKKDRQPRESTLGDISEALGQERSFFSDILAGRRAKVPASRPKAKPKAEDYLEEISTWMGTVDQRLDSIDKRLDRIDTALGFAPRPDIGPADPPETGN